jgi:hypothetical protein
VSASVCICMYVYAFLGVHGACTHVRAYLHVCGCMCASFFCVTCLNLRLRVWYVNVCVCVCLRAFVSVDVQVRV